MSLSTGMFKVVQLHTKCNTQHPTSVCLFFPCEWVWWQYMYLYMWVQVIVKLTMLIT